MPPIRLCLNCEGAAYGWTRGPCTYCGSPNVVATDGVAGSGEDASDYRLIFLSNKERAHLEAEAILARRSPSDLLAEHEQAEIMLTQEEPAGHGQLVLLKTNREEA